MRRAWAVVGCALLVGCAIEVPEVDRFIAERCEWRVPVADANRDFTIAAVIPVKLHGEKVDSDAVARARAMQLAVEDANERQGLHGRRFGFRVCDKGGDWVSFGHKKAAHIGRWLGDHGVAAIISGGSNDTLAIHAASLPQKTLVMSLGATAADITHLTDEDLLWRVAPSDLYQGVVMSKVLSDAGAKQVAAVVIDNAYGDSLAKILRDNAGSMTVKTYALAGGATKADNVLALLNKQKPDYIVVAANVGLGKVVLDALAASPTLGKTPLLLSDALHKADFIKSLANPAAVTGALGTLPGDPVGPTFDAFATHFQLRFSDDATQRSFSAHSYDAAYTLILAHAWALRGNKDKAVTGPDIADGLKQLSDPNGAAHQLLPTSYIAATSALLAGKAINVSGASGPLDFDNATGEPTSAVEVWQVQADGSFKTLKWLRAEPAGDSWSYTEIKPKS